MKAHLVRQGDVLIFPAPKSVKAGKELPREDGLVILAKGEATGHHHSFSEEGVTLYETEALDDQLLVIEADGAILRHQEHAPIEIPKGRYIRRIQREYTPQAIRNVAD